MSSWLHLPKTKSRAAANLPDISGAAFRKSRSRQQVLRRRRPEPERDERRPHDLVFELANVEADHSALTRCVVIWIAAVLVTITKTHPIHWRVD